MYFHNRETGFGYISLTMPDGFEFHKEFLLQSMAATSGKFTDLLPLPVTYLDFDGTHGVPCDPVLSILHLITLWPGYHQVVW